MLPITDNWNDSLSAIGGGESAWYSCGNGSYRQTRKTLFVK
jgi:hypothetical protein